MAIAYAKVLPGRRRRPGPAPTIVLAVVFALLAALPGCSYIFSEIRTVHQYEPAYGADSPEFRRSLDAFGTEMVPNNRVTLLQNGDEIFASLLEAFGQASASINIETYIFDHGSIATRVARALADRARHGIAVRLLVDGFGSSLGDLKEEMTAAGVKVEIYKPLRIYSLDKVGNRTHRRIFTIDGRVGFCGGVGIDDRWKGNARNPGEWRETMVKVEGPVVAQLQHVFFEDWVHTTGEVLHGTTQFPTIEPVGDVLAQAISSSRTDQSSMAKLQYCMAIQAARRRIWIENAYFVPDRQIREGLVHAAERGVDVRIIVPGKYIDSPSVRNASRFHYNELLDGGVQVFEYLPTMMHNKVMVVDGIWTSIGSINFVNRSMKLLRGGGSLAVISQDVVDIETLRRRLRLPHRHAAAGPLTSRPRHRWSLGRSRGRAQVGFRRGSLAHRTPRAAAASSELTARHLPNCSTVSPGRRVRRREPLGGRTSSSVWSTHGDCDLRAERRPGFLFSRVGRRVSRRRIPPTGRLVA